MALVFGIDDDPDILALLGKVCEKAEHQFQSAVSWSEASDIVLDPLPDLFIVDLDMPEQDGFQVIDEIRTKVAAEVPVIVFSAFGVAKEVAEQKPNVRFVSKTDGMDKLAEVINTIL